MSSADDRRYGGIDPDVSPLRPYLLTFGRTQPVDRTLEVEAQVVTTQRGAAAEHSLTFERRDIVELCHDARSVAEVAAILTLHIGVARVLVADLAELGYVIVRRPKAQPNQDIDMIERVIRGLQSIS